MILFESIKRNGMFSMKMKPGRRKTGLEARKARKRAGLLLRGFVSSQFKDKRRREKLRKPKPGEAAEGWE